MMFYIFCTNSKCIVQPFSFRDNTKFLNPNTVSFKKSLDMYKFAKETVWQRQYYTI